MVDIRTDGLGSFAQESAKKEKKPQQLLVLFSCLDAIDLKLSQLI